MNNSQISQYEEIAARAWPARDIERLDGWVMRANDGVTWRTNTVLPSGPITSISLEDAISRVIEFYRAKGIPPAFKLTRASVPENLDSILETMGFQKRMVTHLQTAEIETIGTHASEHDVQIRNEPYQNWIDSYAQMGEFDEFTRETRLGIIDRIGSPIGLAEVRMDGQIVGIGT